MNNYEESLTDAKKTLKTTWVDSLIDSGKFFLGGVTILGVLGGGLEMVNSNGLTMPEFKVMVIISFLFGLLSLIFLEFRRLLLIKLSLEQLLSANRNYEMLLDDARRERDEFKAKVSDLEIKNSMLAVLGSAIEEIKKDILTGMKMGAKDE